MTDEPQNEPEKDEPEEGESDPEWSRHRKKDILACPLSPASLVGSWFHKIQDDEIVMQGVVVGEPQAGVYLLEVDGPVYPAYQIIAPLAQMTDDDESNVVWRFYDEEEQRLKAWTAYCERERA